mgnify:CR=1 FL=1
MAFDRLGWVYAQLSVCHAVTGIGNREKGIGIENLG